MIDLKQLASFNRPFPHWVGVIADDKLVRQINDQWPDSDSYAWLNEDGAFAKKSALMFPNKLPPIAQQTAQYLYSKPVLDWFSRMLGFEVLADPWFENGPLVPRVGGGLHEIHTGGLLKMHVDFDAHPTGLCRAVNLLLYLNLNWDSAWGGELQLNSDGDSKTIVPYGGVAVLFVTNDRSWHGHPHPLRCPKNRSRRSLALYYYRSNNIAQRKTTVYRNKV